LLLVSNSLYVKFIIVNPVELAKVLLKPRNVIIFINWLTLCHQMLFIQLSLIISLEWVLKIVINTVSKFVAVSPISFVILQSYILADSPKSLWVILIHFKVVKHENLFLCNSLYGVTFNDIIQNLFHCWYFMSLEKLLLSFWCCSKNVTHCNNCKSNVTNHYLKMIKFNHFTLVIFIRIFFGQFPRESITDFINLLENIKIWCHVLWIEIELCQKQLSVIFVFIIKINKCFLNLIRRRINSKWVCNILKNLCWNRSEYK
jgi:hypothetical protein